MISLEKPPLDELVHFGIMGMHWGHRKSQSNTGNSSDSKLNIKTKGVSVKADGSITVEAGASLQRLVRSNGESMPLKGLTYASLSDYDNAKYVKFIGGKGFFGGGRDTIVQLTATEPIKAPSVDEASKIVSDLFINDSKFRKTVTNMSGDKITNKELAMIKKDPTGTKAKEWYEEVNTALTFGADFDPTAPYVQKTIRETFKKNGYNAVRDENDFQTGVSKAPIIIFSPEKTLKVTKVSAITDDLRRASKEKLKQYNRLGNDWVQQQFYDQ